MKDTTTTTTTTTTPNARRSIPFVWVGALLLAVGNNTGLGGCRASLFVTGFRVNDNANAGRQNRRNLFRPQQHNQLLLLFFGEKYNESVAGRNNNIDTNIRLNAWKPGGGDNDNDDDDGASDFNAAFSARKSGIERGEKGNIDNKSNRAVSQTAKDDRFMEDAKAEIQELRSRRKRQINVASLVFVPTVLAVVFFFFRVSLDPFFRAETTTYDETTGEPIVKVTKKDLKDRPNARVVDFDDLLGRSQEN